MRGGIINNKIRFCNSISLVGLFVLFSIYYLYVYISWILQWEAVKVLEWVEVLVVQAWQSEFRSQNPWKQSGTFHWIFDPNTVVRNQRLEDGWDLLATSLDSDSGRDPVSMEKAESETSSHSMAHSTTHVHIPHTAHCTHTREREREWNFTVSTSFAKKKSRYFQFKIWKLPILRLSKEKTNQ